VYTNLGSKPAPSQPFERLPKPCQVLIGRSIEVWLSEVALIWT
jgi:hypothetical protein